MTYLNHKTGNGRGATVVTVAALHVAAGWALINGLGIEYVKEKVFNLPTTNYPVDTPVQPLPEPPKPDARADRDSRIIAADPVVIKPGTTTFTLPPIEPPMPVDIGEALVPLSGPSFDPGPRFEPIGAKPKGKPGQWVSTNDYPTRDIREGNEGMVRFLLAIDASGRTTGCEILRSSGHAGLDAATCEKLRQRARFDPARDDAGERFAGTYSGTVR